MTGGKSSGTVLDEIIGGVREDLIARRRDVSEAAVASAAAEQPVPPTDPMPGLRSARLSVIAEVKRASPSKGDLADIADPAGLASEYAAGGAAAISVLTEQRRFRGSLDDLRAVRSTVRTPVLRKDFVVTGYQVDEARAAGADLVLLIVAALDDALLQDLFQHIRGLGMTPLVEVHDEAETERAVDLGAELIGVNARNLKTLEVDADVFGRLAPLVPHDRVLVAESGIAGVADAQRYADQGARAVLVGEALVRTGDPRAAVAEMTGLEVTR